MSLNHFTVNCDGDFFVILTFDVFVTNEIVSLSLYQLSDLMRPRVTMKSNKSTTDKLKPNTPYQICKRDLVKLNEIQT